jgi:hypothetical protein
MKRLFLVVVPLLVVLLAGPAFAGDSMTSAGTSTGDDGGPDGSCWASADCWDGSTVTCFGGSTCTSVDNNCPTQRGYVKCDGSYTFCPFCPTCSREGDACDSDSECRRPLEPACQYCFCLGLLDLPIGEEPPPQEDGECACL